MWHMIRSVSSRSCSLWLLPLNGASRKGSPTRIVIFGRCRRFRDRAMFSVLANATGTIETPECLARKAGPGFPWTSALVGLRRPSGEISTTQPRSRAASAASSARRSLELRRIHVPPPYSMSTR
jgi:hypothetical protein